jgi:two-component sensor histidine kinase
MKKDSITKAVFIYMILVVTMSNLLLGVVFGVHSYFTYLKETEKNKDNYIEQEKAKIKAEVDKIFGYIRYQKSLTEEKLKSSIKEKVYMAHDIVRNIHKVNKEAQIPEEKILLMIKETLRPVRFNDGRGYYFIVDMEGNELLYPTKPEYENTNLINLTDDRGKYVIQEEIKRVKENGEGFVKAHWIKPNADNKMIYPKISFVKLFEPMDFLIGTGEYLDDVEKDTQEEVLKWIQDIESNDSDYVFVFDHDGNFLTHNKKDNLKGKNVYEIEDTSERKTFERIYEKSLSDDDETGQYLCYDWNKPGKEEPRPKISYFKNLGNNWKWIIGKGVYLDDLEQIYKIQEELASKNFSEKLVIISFYLLILIGFSVLVAIKISKSVGNNLNTFTNFFKKSQRESTHINLNELNCYEFKEIAHQANKMVKKQNQVKKQLETSLKEKEILLKELHHRVKNNLQVISSLLRLQTHYIERNNMEIILKETQNRVKSMALIHERLYKKENLRNIDITSYIIELSYNLIVSYKVDLQDILIKKDMARSIMLTIDKAIPCGLILNELITNCIQHAFRKDQPDKTIELKLEQINDKLHITVKDNGIGILYDIDEDPKTFGFLIVKMLVDQLEGKIQLVKTDIGTEFILSFPG